MIDEEAEGVVEEVLTELEQNLMSLMDTIAGRSTSRNRHPRTRDKGAEPEGGRRRASRESRGARRSSRGGGLSHHRSGARIAADGNIAMASSPSPIDDRCHDYDEDVDRFLECVVLS